MLAQTTLLRAFILPAVIVVVIIIVIIVVTVITLRTGTEDTDLSHRQGPSLLGEWPELRCPALQDPPSSLLLYLPQGVRSTGHKPQQTKQTHHLWDTKKLYK